MRDQHLADDFKRWLDRFSPPASIKGNGMAMQDAADALLRLILRKAPRDGYTMWLAEVLELTEATMKTRAWPTMHELGAACVNAARTDAPPPTVLDAYAINARRIHSGESVGESFIYGREAVELIRRGLVTDGDMTAHRSGAFFRAKDAWGLDAALAHEAELKARHSDAAHLARLS